MPLQTWINFQSSFLGQKNPKSIIVTLTDCSIVLLYGLAHQRKIEKYLKAAKTLEFYSKNYSITNTVMYLAILYLFLRR